MEFEYTEKFSKDLFRQKHNTELIRSIAKKVQHISRAASASEISGLVPIRKKNSRYRIKIKLTNKKVFRIGIVILKNKVWLACIDSDKQRFYKRFL